MRKLLLVSILFCSAKIYACMSPDQILLLDRLPGKTKYSPVPRLTLQADLFGDLMPRPAFFPGFSLRPVQQPLVFFPTAQGIPFRSSAVFCRMENQALNRFHVKFSIHAGVYRE